MSGFFRSLNPAESIATIFLISRASYTGFCPDVQAQILEEVTSCPSCRLCIAVL